MARTALQDISRFRFRRVLYIAVFWTAIDAIIKLLEINFRSNEIIGSLLIREVLVFIMSLIMGYLFVYALRSIFAKGPPLVNFLAKSFVLMLAALLMNFTVHFVENMAAMGMSPEDAVNSFFVEMLDRQWLLKKTLYWIVLFVITQLYLEINDKYSPGVFIDILLGKYRNPKVENRIIMFLDLKDSTPIAERLGHELYFHFIRDFIRDVSLAIIEKSGIIYQYVGDEIVVSWTDSRSHCRYSISSIILANKNLQKRAQYYKLKYEQVPEFRVGLHVGEVTIGEIGVIKKDLAISGDTMNTTARLRTACGEYNAKYIVSENFVQHSGLKDFQVKSLGLASLKGKSAELEIFSLVI